MPAASLKKVTRKPTVDLTEQTFGRLTVLYGEMFEYDSVKSPRRWAWVCSCECGNTVKVPNHALLSGNTKSCGCLKLSSQKLPGDEGAFNHIYNRYKFNSRTRKPKEFLLTPEEFREISSKRCNYCGLPPQPHYSRAKRESIPYLCNGIDRLDSQKGYVKENCVPCCEICNYMKRVLGLEDFIRQCRRIADYTRGEI